MMARSPESAISWTFDEAYSAFAVTGMKTGRGWQGPSPKGELEDLAKLNVESLNEFSYFTVLKQGSERAWSSTDPPPGYFLEA
jgi:ABC-type uncharacterized transport system substrate-binding protein